MDFILEDLKGLLLLRMVGNPVVSSYRHYRKKLLAGMVQLNYLDESPCFPKDRRLAEAFMAGGLEAERAMREQLRREDQEKEERNRKAFDDMVAKARANPPAPLDPMRFRAVPPGESDSDEEGLPPSYRKKKADKVGGGASVSSEPSAAVAAAAPRVVLDEEEKEEEGKGQPAVSSSSAAAAPGRDDGEGVLSGISGFSLNSPCAGQEGEGEATAPAPPPPSSIPPSDQALENEVSQAIGFHASPPFTPPPPQDFVAELQQRAIERAAARAEAALVLGDTGAGGGGDATSPRSAEAAAAARGKPPPQVWGTANYRRLWDLAMQVGEQQEREAQGEGGQGSGEAPSSPPSLALENGAGAAGGREADAATTGAAGASSPPPISSPRPALATADGPATPPVTRARGGGIADSLDEPDLDSAHGGVRPHAGEPLQEIPVIDMDSARGEDLLEDLDSAEEEQEETQTIEEEGDDEEEEEEGGDVASTTTTSEDEDLGLCERELFERYAVASIGTGEGGGGRASAAAAAAPGAVPPSSALVGEPAASHLLNTVVVSETLLQARAEYVSSPAVSGPLPHHSAPPPDLYHTLTETQHDPHMLGLARREATATAAAVATPCSKRGPPAGGLVAPVYDGPPPPPPSSSFPRPSHASHLGKVNAAAGDGAPPLQTMDSVREVLPLHPGSDEGEDEEALQPREVGEVELEGLYNLD